ncbi:MAG: dihydroorotase [Candidatus Omnitrophica bacterium CG23_combo_of_CG06-09_8_20_14_all_40_11]|nr:MAG: dihydroorotase [Candidatus Omnitrophica bacterium CG23_combo_of_CG06-09_8_20_14_all_40_11]
MKILIKNGRVIDPANNIDGIYDILVENDKISQVAKNITTSADNIVDAADKIVMPGIVDMHVHLREPGREDKETIATATMAALRGGVTSLLAMPNTQPAIDCAENVKLLKSIIDKTAKVNVFICAAITKERLGKELTGILKLKKEGVVAISDDGSSVDSDELMLKALKRARKQDILVISHCEDKSFSAGGVVNLGIVSTRLGLRGISRASEYKRVQRDLQLAEKAKARIHIAHVSCKESVELIARAKKKGIKVTAEVTPHHFALSEEAVLGFDTNMKMNPPLRSKEDKEALKEGLKNGIIDAIASDHAPHTENEKEIEFERAEFGVIGLETELAVSITELVKAGLLDWVDLVNKLCLNPAKILGINKPSSCAQGLGKGTLSIGSDADILVVLPDKEWMVEKEGFLSKSKNSAFLGKKLTGAVELTICNGKINEVYPEQRIR